MDRPARSPARGFTLVESMLAVGIAAILSAIALPSLEGQLQRVRRADAMVAMLSVQLAQERWRSHAPQYTTLDRLGLPAHSTHRHYALAVEAADASGYAIVATALGTQRRDTACRVLRMSVVDGEVERASGPDEAVANDAAANRRCWNR